MGRIPLLGERVECRAVIPEKQKIYFSPTMNRNESDVKVHVRTRMCCWHLLPVQAIGFCFAPQGGGPRRRALGGLTGRGAPGACVFSCSGAGARQGSELFADPSQPQTADHSIGILHLFSERSPQRRGRGKATLAVAGGLRPAISPAPPPRPHGVSTARR
jgi:hypothetical protein